MAISKLDIYCNHIRCSLRLYLPIWCALIKNLSLHTGVKSMSAITEHIGLLIREARKGKGLTQKEVGEKLGITEGAYNRYESGKQNLTVETIGKICNALGVSFKILIE